MLGANTVIPAATSAWCWGEKVGRSWASGPPCRLSIAGPGPIWPGGRYSQPVSGSPSRPWKYCSVGRTSPAVGSPGPAVTRVQTRVAMSSRQSSRGLTGPSTLSTAVLPSRLSSAPLTDAAEVRRPYACVPVRVSSRVTSLPPPAVFQTSSSSEPASSASRPSSSASSRGGQDPGVAPPAGRAERDGDRLAAGQRGVGGQVGHQRRSRPGPAG